MFLESDRVGLGLEGAHLHALVSATFDGMRRFEHVEAYSRGPRNIDIDGFGGGSREVDDAVAAKGAPVGDAYHRGLMALQVDHSHNRIQRQGLVRRGHFVLVIDFAVGSFLIVEVGTVPACVPYFTPKDLGVGIDVNARDRGERSAVAPGGVVVRFRRRRALRFG
jgi:hypothetical protein